MVATQPLELSVVVPTYRRVERALRLIDALEAQTFDPERFEVIIVDNGSRDGTADRLRGRAERSPLALRILEIDDNHGPAPARNLGLQRATAPIVAYTDDDCVPEPGWLAALVCGLSDPGVGVVQGTTEPPEGAEIRWWTAWRQVQGESPWFEACNIAYRRSALLDAGGFDESIGWYGEDTAAGWTVLEQGWRRTFVADAVVRHDVDERGVRWHVDNALLERNLVGLATRFPGFRRDAFWAAWAFRRENALLALGLVGVALAACWRPALLLVLPYAVVRRHLLRHPGGLRYAAEAVLIDGAQLLGHLRGSVEHRALVL